ncbi:MAG: hypothetical protein K6B65_00305 [Bacilli bacterium]|nr:hypothetical protein [Bacilli bacterium]
MLFKKGRFYRLLTITLAFVVLGMAAFLPLFASGVGDSNRVALFVALGVYGAIYLATIIGNEIYIIFKKKKDM